MLLFDIPIVRDLSFFLLLLLKNTSVDIPLLTKAFAKVKLVKPSPRIQTFIIILILTTKIR